MSPMRYPQLTHGFPLTLSLSVGPLSCWQGGLWPQFPSGHTHTHTHTPAAEGSGLWWILGGWAAGPLSTQLGPWEPVETPIVVRVGCGTVGTFLASGTHKPALGPRPTCLQEGTGWDSGAEFAAHGVGLEACLKADPETTYLKLRCFFLRVPHQDLDVGSHTRSAREALAPAPAPARAGLCRWAGAMRARRSHRHVRCWPPSARRDLRPGRPFGCLATQDCPCPVHQCSEALRPPPPPSGRTEPNPALYGHIRVWGGGRWPRYPPHVCPAGDWPAGLRVGAAQAWPGRAASRELRTLRSCPANTPIPHPPRCQRPGL